MDLEQKQNNNTRSVGVIQEFPKGINEEIVTKISQLKKEPKWMLDFRLEAYHAFRELPMPTWGPDLSDLQFDDIKYYATAGDRVDSWDDVPDDIRETFEALKVPEIERKFLAGMSTQYESEMIYHKLQKQWSDLGIVFDDCDSGLRKYEDLYKQYFGKLIPIRDHKFAALNSAVWSGGSFVYIPKGVKLTVPVQTYFRINTENMGQFERTLIIADEGSEVHYIEGCTAPQYSTNSLHAAVVEIFALKGAKVRYTTVQNWSTNVYNLVTKRAQAEEGAIVEWVDCNLGSKVTMKYPMVLLKGDRSHGELLSLAFASDGQVIDAGGKMVHIGKNTSSIIKSKSISRGNGKAVYRGISKITKNAENSRARVICDGLLLDENSKSYAYPYDTVSNSSSIMEHEASISRVSEEQLFYLTSRGISEDDAMQMIVSGFMDPVTNQLPMEYSVEIERLLEYFLKRGGKGHAKKT